MCRILHRNGYGQRFGVRCRSRELKSAARTSARSDAMHRAVVVATLTAVLAVLSSCNSNSSPECPTCAQAKLKNQWCDHCGVGYVAGAPIRSKILFEALDAHGHDLVLAAIQCPECKAAIE